MGTSISKFRSKRHECLVVSVLLLHAVLLGYGAYIHSPCADETGHLTAGVSHWQFGRFELYRVNPPLVRMVAALPVVIAGPQTDWSGYYDAPGARPVFGLGRRFADINGARTFWLTTLARWTCIPFSLLGAIICYRWTSKLCSRRAGVISLTLWCFSPNILAHGQLITPDVGATSLGLAATYCFWMWVRNQQWSDALLAGLTLGLALLTKMTMVLLPVIWIGIWLVVQLLPLRRIGKTANSPDASEAARQASTEFGELPTGQSLSMLATTMLIALWVLNLGYGFEGTGEHLGNYVFVSSVLAGTESGHGNRFADSWMGHVPVFLPKNYVLGVDVQKSDFEKHMLSYLRGELRDRGWWYYYLYALAIKVPIGTWLLLVLATVVAWSGRSCVPSWLDLLVLLTPVFVILTFVSSQTGFNHHMRYVLPILPFVFIWIGCAIDGLWRYVVPSLFVIGALLWSVISSLWVYPHSLSYFNEWVGGPRHGHHHLIDSNIDWGQDLLNLKRWLNRHPEAEPLQLAFFGNCDPRHAGIDYALPPRCERHSDGKVVLNPGWYAVSVNFLRGYPWHVPNGQGDRDYLARDSVSYFQRLAPTSRVGFSIYIYHVPTPMTLRCTGRPES